MQKPQSDDIKHMRRALALARKGMGHTCPNPMVGAVIVKNGKVLGEGYHYQFGGPHAEIVALKGLSRRQTAGATLYVNLEPCCHYGKTPPCLPVILDSAIRRTVIGIIDPNPLVNGRSIEALKQKGIEVQLGVLEKATRELNRGYLKHITTGLPWVTMKIAQTLDGRIADPAGYSAWISGEAARKTAHRLRATHDAVLVGIGTVMQDDPRLTVRNVRGRQPRRIVLDPNLKTPPEAALLQQKDAGPVWIVTSKNRDKQRQSALESRGARLLTIQNGEPPFPWEHILRLLGNNGVTSLLVEGGGGVCTGLLRERAVDRLMICMAPKVLGGAAIPAIGDLGIASLTEALRYRIIRHRRLGEDLCIELEPINTG
jgi:diaminohydroxyphosphoribosylaminopyrimidine deaminase/5-amino-6-(5-phosphoribosylamino)uracil reductase